MRSRTDGKGLVRPIRYYVVKKWISSSQTSTNSAHYRPKPSKSWWFTFSVRKENYANNNCNWPTELRLRCLYAIYIESHLDIFQTLTKETGYKITDMSITTGNGFVIAQTMNVNMLEKTVQKDHCFKFISTQLNFDGIYSTDILASNGQNCSTTTFSHSMTFNIVSPISRYDSRAILSSRRRLRHKKTLKSKPSTTHDLTSSTNLVTSD